MTERERHSRSEISKRPLSYESFLESHGNTASGKKSFLCYVCGVTFTLKSNLVKHQLTHARERHTCETCGRVFYLNSSLRRHLLRHNREKLFKCDTCKKVFSKNENLQAHMLMHTTNEYFSCKICAMEFCSSSSLESHMPTHSDSSMIHGVCQRMNSINISNSVNPQGDLLQTPST